jgi:MCP family monocarboxylic acid transporter-like MFS transporter 13
MKEAPYAWVVVWATFFALAIIFGVSYSFAAFFASFADEFGAQRADVSLVFGLSGAVYFVFGAAAGMLADRFGPRAVTCAGMLLIAAGLALCSFAGSMPMVYAAYGVGVGLGIALVYTPAIACVQPWFTQRRGFAAGLASAGIGAGTLAVPLIASAGIALAQWRGAMRALALGVLVLGLSATWLLRRAPAASAARSDQVPGLSLGQALRDRRYGWLYLSIVLSAPGMFIPFAHVSAAARDIGIDAARAVGLVGLIGLGSLVGRFVIGALADRMGRARTLVLMQLSAGLSYLAWYGAGDYASLAGFALWFGLSYGGIVSLLPPVAMDLFGARAVAGIIGTLYSGAALGNLFGPVLAGWVFDRGGSYVPVLWACMALSVLAALASARLLGSRAPAY